MMNLADLYRAQKQDELALPLMQRALILDPDNIMVNYSLGLLYIRLKQLDPAVEYLWKASSLAPQVAHYSYVYAVALYESGKQDVAILVLKETLARHPGHPDILMALVGYLQQMGRALEAQQYAEQLPPR